MVYPFCRRYEKTDGISSAPIKKSGFLGECGVEELLG